MKHRGRESSFGRLGFTGAGVVMLVLLVPREASAMHLSEGILPAKWALLWLAIAIPFVLLGIRKLKEKSDQFPAFKPHLGMMGAAVFLISAMPIPVPVAGSCSHPAGTGIAAIIIGPFMTVVITSIALLIQALFMAHGGLTTWGADVVSMGVVGSFAGYGVFLAMRKLKFPLLMAAFAAGLVGDWATYAATSMELASALRGTAQFGDVFTALVLAFAPTQVPLGILEGFMSVGAVSFLLRRRPDILSSWGVMKNLPGFASKEARV